MKIKNMTAFLLAAVALYSCGREELPEKTENADGVVLHAGLVSVQTRTWLDSEGSKDNTTKKVYWSDGDKINVNGQVSSSVTVTEGQKVSDADFHLRSVDGPYNVIYPHDIVLDEVYDETGCITISLASSQTYHQTTFASGAAVMYGYSESKNVALQNLCAAVRVNLTGAVGVSAATVVSESVDAPVCGTFRLCPKTGELTAVEGSTALELEFDEVTLAPEGTDFYFTIPAGDYPAGLSFYFTNASDGRKMQCTWKPQTALEAGRLYSFNEVAYAPEAKDIETAQEWEEFVLALAGEGDLGKYLYKDGAVRLGADIEGDLSSIPDDFTYILDGAGHTLTRANATKALFSTLSGEVRNLTVAGNLTLADEGAPLVNILAAGGKVVNCTNKMTVTFELADHAYVGGIVKTANGGTIEGCVNDGVITVKIDISAADKNAAVGGILARVEAADADVIIKDSKNTSEVILMPNSADDASFGMKVCGLGGIVGWVNKAQSVTFDNCDNEGNVTFSADLIKGVNGTAAYSICVGGVLGIGAPQNTGGYLITPSAENGYAMTFTGCDNIGTVYNGGVVYLSASTSTKKQTNKRVFTGGLAGSLLGKEATYASLTSCTNTGKVYTYDLTGDTASKEACYCAVSGGLVGFGGYLDMDACTVNCTMGNGKRAVMSYGGVIGCAVMPFELHNSDVFVSGYYQRIGNYQGNRAAVAAVPVLFGTNTSNTMNIAPKVGGSLISNCRIGGNVMTTSSALSTANGEKTDDLLNGYDGTILFGSAATLYSEDGSVNNLVAGQGYTTAADDVTVTGFTYWDGK